MARILWHSCAPWSPSGYGMQTAIWAQKLIEEGHEVIISTFWGLNGSATQWNGIVVLPGFGGNYCSASLEQHAKYVQPDLVITLGDIWVLDPAKFRDLPAAHWVPGDCRPMSVADRGFLDASAPQLIAMSRFGRDRFRQAGFSPYYVPHGIDFNVFKPADKAAAREKTGLGDEFVIGVNAANNDAIRKAAPEMMLAFARFIQDYPNSILSLHTGVHQDGGQDLEEVAMNLGITDKIRVVDQYRYASGMIDLPDIASWYSALDVLCSTTYAEGFGIPIIEAKACGIPVITTRCSSMEELNPDGIQVDGQPFWNGVHRGWWIRPDIRGITAAFEQAYHQRNDVDMAKIRESASDYTIENVSEKHMMPTVNALLERFGRLAVAISVEANIALLIKISEQTPTANQMANNAIASEFDKSVERLLKMKIHGPMPAGRPHYRAFGVYYEATPGAPPAMGSGDLLASMVRSPASRGIVSKAVVANTAIYAAVLEFGLDTWTSGNFMQWHNDAGWWRKKYVHQNEHSFFRKALEGDIMSGVLTAAAMEGFEAGMSLL